MAAINPSGGTTVRLRFTDPARHSRRDRMREERDILTCLDQTGQTIHSKGVEFVPDGVIILLRSEEDVEKTLSVKSKERLLGIGFETLDSPEQIAKKTVVCHTKSQLIHACSIEDLKREIHEKYNDKEKKKENKIKIVELWKDAGMGIMKIQLRTQTEAKTLKEKGLHLQMHYFPPEDLEFGEYIPLIQCMTCYMYDDHTTRNCEETRIICSECAEIGHRFKQCDSRTNRCVNCMREGRIEEATKHRTRSSKCPSKKRAMNRYRNGANANDGNAREIQAFEPAPLPSTNAWGDPDFQRGRSGSSGSRGSGRTRGRGRGRGRGGQNRGGSQALTYPPYRPQHHGTPPTDPIILMPPPLHPAPQAKNKFPALAHNRQARVDAERRLPHVVDGEIRYAETMGPRPRPDEEPRPEHREDGWLHTPVRPNGRAAGVHAEGATALPMEVTEASFDPVDTHSDLPRQTQSRDHWVSDRVEGSSHRVPLEHSREARALPTDARRIGDESVRRKEWETRPPDPSSQLPTCPTNVERNVINIIISYAHHHNISRPGSFNFIANHLFAQNNLPQVDFRGIEWHSEDWLIATSKLKNRSCNCAVSQKTPKATPKITADTATQDEPNSYRAPPDPPNDPSPDPQPHPAAKGSKRSPGAVGQMERPPDSPTPNVQMASASPGHLDTRQSITLLETPGYTVLSRPEWRPPDSPTPNAQVAAATSGTPEPMDQASLAAKRRRNTPSPEGETSGKDRKRLAITTEPPLEVVATNEEDGFDDTNDVTIRAPNRSQGSENAADANNASDAKSPTQTNDAAEKQPTQREERPKLSAMPPPATPVKEKRKVKEKRSNSRSLSREKREPIGRGASRSRSTSRSRSGDNSAPAQATNLDTSSSFDSVNRGDEFISTFEHTSDGEESCYTPPPRPDKWCTPLEMSTPLRKSMEGHKARSLHRNPSNASVSSSASSVASIPKRINWRLSNSAQMIAREEILRCQPIITGDANSPSDRTTIYDLQRHFSMIKLMRLIKSKVVAVTLTQQQGSPFSRDLLTRVLYEDLISAERWNETLAPDLEKAFKIKRSTTFHSELAEMQRLRKLSYTTFPDTMEGWKALEDHLLEAFSKQKKKSDEAEDGNIEAEELLHRANDLKTTTQDLERDKKKSK